MEPDIDPTTQPAPPINPMASIDQMSQAAGSMPPQQTAPVDQPTGPESTAPPWMGMADPNTIEASAAAVHHSRLAQTLHNVIDAVGNVLGGPQTVHVTKQQDGSVQVTHDPSTTGEKWGRVAQAALGGLAQGFAAGPGPGGIGRAGAGGISAGMAMPQQREDQANQAAQQQNTALYQKQTADANKAIHQQEIAKNTMQLADMGEKYSQAQVDRANENADWILSNPSNKHVGTMGSMKDVLEFERTHEDMMHNMTHGGYHVEATNEDGKPVFKLYTFDQALADQKNDKPVTYKVLDTGDDGKLAIKDYTVPTGAMTNGAIASAHEASTKAITAWELANAKERQAEQPKTPAELAYDAQNNPDPAKRAASTAALQKIQNSPAIQATIGAENARAAASTAEAGLRDEQTEQLKNRRPGGTPVPVENPNYPPVANFDADTDGIAPPPKSGGYKIPADTEKAARLSRNIQHNGKIINDIVGRRPDLVGTVNSLGSNWQQKIVGTHDPDLTALDGAMKQLAIASVGAHGSRSAPLIEGIDDGALNHFKNGPAAIQAYISGQMNSVQTFIDEEQNYQHYGTSTGPSAAARARAVAKAPTAPGGPAAAPDTSQAAHAPGAAPPPALTAPHAPAARDPKGAITLPPGAVPGYDKKTHQLIGYQDANGWHG